MQKTHWRNGIIFLDEIHALSVRSQKTLLKAIEEKEFYPVGSNKPVKSNFRVISATCENIQELISSGKFRNDLFARISTFQINLLPLRERKEDIDLLFEYFISKYLVQVLITTEAKALLRNYSWPRNTREIQDLVENWIVNGQRLITPDVLPGHIKLNITQMNSFIPEAYFDFVEEHGLTEFLTFLKKEIAESMIKRNAGSMRQASKAMQVSHSNLSNFLKQNKSKNLYMGAH
jgi:transcriptional regulator with PAS, ATPase and Fis domain